MTLLTRSQTAGMDQKAGETDEAYEAHLAAIMAESKQRAEASAAARKKEAEAERLRRVGEDQWQKHAAAAAKAANEERVRRREILFKEETASHAQAKDWQKEAENGDSVDYMARIALLLNRLEKRPVATSSAGPSDLVDRVNVLEIDVGTLKTETQRLDQQVGAAATPSSARRESIPKFEGLLIFCDASKTEPIPWWRQFELKLDIHHVVHTNRHAYLCSRSGGACQAWLDNMLSAHACTVSELHNFITWADLTAAWKKRFQVEPPEHQAMDKPLTFSQNNMPSGDWISEFQRVASTPKLPLNFDGIKLYFIKRSCPALQNALNQVAENLNTSEELFNKVTQIIVTNLEAKNIGRSSTAGQGAYQHQPRVAVVAAATPSDPSTSNEAASSDEGDGLAAAQNGGRPAKGRGHAESQPTDLSSDPHVVRLLDEFGDIFESPTGVVPDRLISHEVILEAGAVPLKGCIYRMSEEELTVLRARLDDLFDKGWIRPSSSPYGAPVLFVRKKNEVICLCIDYPKLNAQNVKNTGPLPRIDDLLERLGGAIFFSKLDLKSGYHQISIRPQDRYKTAFKTQYVHFEWVVMPFGLTNAPTTFRAAMTNEFRAMLDRFVLVYLDDILVYSRTLEEHLEHLRRVLETLCRAKYKANRVKCEFVRQELEYLGHFVTPQGISPLSDKIQATQDWPEPRNVTDVRSFLGLAGYYQRFIKGYSKIAAHLSKLQCEDLPFDFGTDARGSFLALKAALLSAEVLRIYDPLLPTRVTTDASGYGIGVLLEQHDGVDWHPVEYFSKKVPVVHSIDDARKKELLAFVHALKRWPHFLLGRRQFRWVTDNNPLVFYKTRDTVNSTITRWMAFIDQFDFFPDHIPGKSNHFADVLSRRLDYCTAVYSTFEIEDDLRDSFISGYQADPEFRDKFANCSSPNLAPSHYRIQEGYLLIHLQGKDLLCVPQDSHLRTRLLGEFHDAPAIGHFGVNRTIGRLRERF
ncbi:hypothetical protein CBR_g8850 [Chara braunii]|uniref:Reverse transcriptase domain-containing protein n=1 Tax=Chara braunii TaxID=69332 RepID=A0A388KN17_CHABU|nr:hypothetical protein CBR_g8850 [Chara braunii]|eukprot:GBG71431.1 hypothetical protein CBR_g8850 [Chara braunii]